MPKKEKSRPVRWADAASKCREKYDATQTAADELAEALMELNDIRGEYEDWFDNLPENLQDSPVGQKLAELTNMEIESAANDPLENMGDVEELIDAAEGADLPLGFGRD
jgi:hypothetical protein